MYNSELESMADRGLGAALAQANSVYAVSHLYRVIRGSVTRVSLHYFKMLSCSRCYLCVYSKAYSYTHCPVFNLLHVVIVAVDAISSSTRHVLFIV